MGAMGARGIGMSKLKIKQDDWVIVCDGKKALVLENVGDEKFLNLKTREVFEHPDPSKPTGTSRKNKGSSISFSVISTPRCTPARPSP
jgi:protein required for attachment to host cells